jgi:hypothetical protein
LSTGVTRRGFFEGGVARSADDAGDFGGVLALGTVVFAVFGAAAWACAEGAGGGAAPSTAATELCAAGAGGGRAAEGGCASGVVETDSFDAVTGSGAELAADFEACGTTSGAFFGAEVDRAGHSRAHPTKAKRTITALRAIRGINGTRQVLATDGGLDFRTCALRMKRRLGPR